MLRERSRGWAYLGVLPSLGYRLLGCLFGLLSVLARSDLSKDAELLVLRHKNQVLRRHLSSRLGWDHADRLWLAALSRLVSRRRWPQVFPVAPATILRWHRGLVARKWDYTSRRRPGRPSTGTTVKTHYNGHRPHQSRRQRPPDIETQPVRDAADLRSIRRKPAAAGLINEYHHAA